MESRQAAETNRTDADALLVKRSRVNQNLQDYTDLDGVTDNTAAVNARIAALSALATASKPKSLRFGEGTLLTTGIKPAKNVILDARGCHIKKTGQDGTTAEQPSACPRNAGRRLLRHGLYAGIKIIGGVWDSTATPAPPRSSGCTSPTAWSSMALRS